MAFNPQQINPIDLNPNVAVGVNLPFSGPAVFTPNYTTNDATKNNLINFFLTNPGERPMNPSFGGGLRNFIENQINDDNIVGLKENVNFKVQTYFPNITITTLDVLQNNNDYSLTVKLTYSVNNSNISNNLTLQL